MGSRWGRGRWRSDAGGCRGPRRPPPPLKASYTRWRGLDRYPPGERQLRPRPSVAPARMTSNGPHPSSTRSSFRRSPPHAHQPESARGPVSGPALRLEPPALEARRQSGRLAVLDAHPPRSLSYPHVLAFFASRAGEAEQD